MNKFLFVIITAFLIAVQPATAQHQKHGLTWHTDVEQVYALSQKSGKPVFAFFTGSDWCGWCHKLERAVFEKESFKAWAKKNVILFELDFPRKKQLPQKLAEQNQSLAGFLNVQGFPTVWLFNLDKDSTNGKFSITPYGSLGYPSGSAPGKEDQTFIKNATDILKKKTES